jgi:hypothetical protein
MFPLGSGSDCASEVDSCSLCEDPCLCGLNTTTYMSMLAITQSRYQGSKMFDILCMGLASAIEGHVPQHVFHKFLLVHIPFLRRNTAFTTETTTASTM